MTFCSVFVIVCDNFEFGYQEMLILVRQWLKWKQYCFGLDQAMSQDFRMKLSRSYTARAAREHVEVIKGQKMINSVTYKIPLEDHTVGDLMRIYLLKNSEVRFAGYRVPHPLDDIL